MAFLSLGLNIEEPPTRERVSKTAAQPEHEAGIIDRISNLVEAHDTPQGSTTSVLSAPQNGTNGNSEKTASEPDPAQENWPEMGMQIIQSVLKGAQNKPLPPAPPSDDELSLPAIEELRKKILEGVIPDFNATAENSLAHKQTELASSEKVVEAETDPAEATPPFDAGFPQLMEEIRRKLEAESSSFSFPEYSDPRVSTPIESPARPPRAAEAIPTFSTFKFGYLPGRGLLYSIIGHEVAMFGLFLLITYGLPALRSQTLIVGSQSVQSHLIYLPEVGGGAEGQKSPGGGRSKPQQASAAPARASKGLAYPGAQAILSDPPNPTNAFQTLLRPLMVHAEPLKKLVPMPNIVQMAETRLPSSLLTPKIALPQPHLAVQPIKVKRDNSLHRNAKWNVPVAKAPELMAKAEMPKLPAAQQPLPNAPKVEPTKPEPKRAEDQKPEEKPMPEPLKVAAEKKASKSEKQVAPPSAAQVARLEIHGKAAEPLLSLSPMPLPSSSNAKIPAGEARGRFAVAPGGTLNANSTPGKPNGTRSISPATGQDNSQSANAATELAANSGNGAGHNASAGGGSGNATASSGGGSAGTGNGSGNTSGAGVGGPGTGNGRGSAGTGAGRSGHGAGTGAGAGSGAGSGAFPGITIQGEEGGSSDGNSSSMTVTPQTPYQMTIVATASSGGGLQDFGVFENERVYTVYIPMQRTPQEADPTWTLQYSLAPGSAASGDGQLVAPSPVMREWPQLPADLAKKYPQSQVVVYALLGADGKLTHISVKQTPDPQVSAPIAQALGKWVFRPAQMNNRPVAVKILVGIPL